MKSLLILLSLLFLSFADTPLSIRDKQKKYTRVREAYATKEKLVVKALTDKAINRDSLRIYFRAFKIEKKIELWAKNISDSCFVLVKEFPICEISGEIGPKRRVKDLQVPEGFYYINELNPFSKYHLSVKINYPNASDSIRGVKGQLGSLIFIHGGCESSGCLAITDEKIKEFYVYIIEAMNSGQQKIDITIYPTKLTDANYLRITKAYSKNKDFTSLWADLKASYDGFEQSHNPPKVTFQPDGKHIVN